jgi:hypothetical protein
MAVQSTDLLMVERAGTLHKATVGDLPAPGKTAIDLTHSAGAIALDVQAANLFRFEADAYTPPSDITFQGSAANTSAGNISLTGMGLAENDVVIMVSQGSGTTPSGYTVLRIGGGTDGARINAYYKVMGASPDSSVASGGSTLQALAIGLRGVDVATVLDAPVAYNDASSKTNADAPAVTTVTAGAYVLALLGLRNFDPPIPQGTISGYTHLATTSDTYGSGVDINVSAFGKTVASPGAENPPAHSETIQGGAETTVALRPVAEEGENDYTITLSNIPSSGIAKGEIDLELKTGTGTVTFAGGTVTWRGTVPDFDAAGFYRLGFDADSTGITLWRVA